jgi:hypothetical protein
VVWLGRVLKNAMSSWGRAVSERSQITTMEPHSDVKPSVRERLRERRRASLSPEYDENRRRSVKLKYEMNGFLLECIICKNQLSPPVCQVILT